MSDTITHDVRSIAGETDDDDGLRRGGRAAEIRKSHDVNGLCARFRTAMYSYFGEDVAGYTSGRTKRNMAAIIAMLRGETAEEAYAYVGKAESMTELEDELIITLEEAGFDGIDIGVKAIGPILPLALAILEVTHDVGIPAALGANKHLITESDNAYDFE